MAKKKQTVEWHEECLRNMTEYYKREKEKLTALNASLEKTRSEILFRQCQINTAKERGVKEFSPETQPRNIK